MTDHPFPKLHPGPGLRIRRSIDRPPAQMVEYFRECTTPDVSDLMNGLYTVAGGIKNLVNDVSLTGPACTVKVFPGDNLMIHKALDVVQPGDVVVIDTSGSPNAVLGDLIATKARHRQAAGFVVDGLVRDTGGLQALGLPVFARGVTPLGPMHRGPGEINYPICCGGVVVQPGDIIHADTSGVVVVPREWAEFLAGRLRQKKETTRDYVEAVRQGTFSNRWVEELLEHFHCLEEG